MRTAFVSALIGGWQFSGIYTYQSGFPIGFGNIIFTGNIDDIALPANERTLARWFNTDAGFNKVSAQQLGVERSHVPAAARERADRHRQQRRPVAHQEHAIAAASRSSSGSTRSTRSTIRSSRGRTPTPGSHDAVRQPISASPQHNYARRMQVSVKFLF